MKAMILAAGIGERMRPLTDHTPKPLLTVADQPLIEHHIRRLAAAGFTQLVVNVSHLAQQIMEFCGDGNRWGVSIRYSPEPSPLETAGGIINALALLGDQPFLVVNGDIWIDYDFSRLHGYVPPEPVTAHLVMVANRAHHPRGDFSLDAHGRLRQLGAGQTGLTYTGVAVFTAEFFAGISPHKLPLRPLLDAAIAQGQLGGEQHSGEWEDIGTPERLQALDALVRSRRVPPESVSR